MTDGPVAVGGAVPPTDVEPPSRRRPQPRLGPRAEARSWLVVAVLAAAVAIWFAMLGYRDLIDPDEGRYAEIPREMLTTGDWLTPRLQGLKYFEKPPLQYWATAVGYAVFGVHTWVARLWPALIGFACALWTGWVGRRLFGRDAGDCAFLVTASGLLYFVMGHVLTLDMGVSALLTLGMGSLALAQSRRHEPRAVTAWMLVGWAALAGAVLSKGLEGLVLPAGAVGVYVLWQRDWALLRHSRPVWGVALLAALTVPWFVAVSFANHDFARFFFVHEHLERFTTTEHHREGPYYYFVVIFAVGAVPWLALSLAALTRRELFAPAAPGFRPDRLFWVYVLFVLAFFSLSRSKLPAYILPAWPFVALLAGRLAARYHRWRTDGWVLVALGLSFSAAAVLAPRFATATTPVALLQSYRPWVAAAAAGLVTAGLLALLWRGSLKSMMAVVALVTMTSLQMLLWGMQALAPSRSGHDLARRLEALDLPADAPVYLVANYSPSLAFYLRRVPVIVDYRGELEFGIAAEPDRAVTGLDAFAARWRAAPAAAAVIDNRRTAYLNGGLPMRVVERGPRRTLVVKPAPQHGRERSDQAGGKGE